MHSWCRRIGKLCKCVCVSAKCVGERERVEVRESLRKLLQSSRERETIESFT